MLWFRNTEPDVEDTPEVKPPVLPPMPVWKIEKINGQIKVSGDLLLLLKDITQVMNMLPAAPAPLVPKSPLPGLPAPTGSLEARKEELKAKLASSSSTPKPKLP